MSTVICVVQARMGSSRLPGKVFADLGGRPLLRFLLDRLSPIGVDTVVVATSRSPGDDPVVSAAEAAGVQVVRGSEDDVLARYREAVDRFRPAHVVRITADCPLVDPAVVDAVLGLHLRTGADYTCNVLPRTFPKGLDVEVATAEALRTADREAQEPSEREHVMPFLYRRPERFRLANLRAPTDLSRERWTVDTPEDLARLRDIVNALDGCVDADWQAVLATAGVRWRPPGDLWLRVATANDGELFSIRRTADPASRRTDPPEHDDWYQRRLANPGWRLWVATEDGHHVGAVMVNVRAGVGTVHVIVGPPDRGKGLAARLLTELRSELIGDEQFVGLRALVESSDDELRGAFESAGYRLTGGAEGTLEYRRSPTGP